MNKYNIKERSVLLVMLESRGAITANTRLVLKEIGTSNSEIKTVVLNVLRSSIEISNICLDT
jgi:hypothetical protein